MTSILSERKDEDVDVLRLLSDTQNLALGTAIGVGVQMTYVDTMHSNDDSLSYELNSLNITDSCERNSLNSTHSYEQHSLKHSLKTTTLKNAITTTQINFISHTVFNRFYIGRMQYNKVSSSR